KNQNRKSQTKAQDKKSHWTNGLYWLFGTWVQILCLAYPGVSFDAKPPRQQGVLPGVVNTDSPAYLHLTGRKPLSVFNPNFVIRKEFSIQSSVNAQGSGQFARS